MDARIMLYIAVGLVIAFIFFQSLYGDMYITDLIPSRGSVEKYVGDDSDEPEIVEPEGVNHFEPVAKSVRFANPLTDGRPEVLTPCEMQAQIKKNDIYDHPVQAQNYHINEMEAEFGSEYTNLPEFFSQNPEMFMQEIHNPYVPDAVTWSEKGECRQPMLDSSIAVIGQQTGLDKASYI